jgi:hypothetical protein
MMHDIQYLQFIRLIGEPDRESMGLQDLAPVKAA